LSSHEKETAAHDLMFSLSVALTDPRLRRAIFRILFLYIDVCTLAVCPALLLIGVAACSCVSAFDTPFTRRLLQVSKSLFPQSGCSMFIARNPAMEAFKPRALTQW
jgi:hypothetical protein